MNPIMSFGSWMTGSGTGQGGPHQRRDGVFISVANVAALSASEDGIGTKGAINMPMYVFEMEDRWGGEGNSFGAEFPGIQTRRSTAGGRKHNLGVLPDGSPANRAKRLAGRKMRAYGVDPRLLTGSNDTLRTALKSNGRYWDSDRHFYGWNHVMMVWHGEVSGGTNAQGVGGWTRAVGNNRYPSKPNCEIYINGIQAGFATGTQAALPLHGGLDEWKKQGNQQAACYGQDKSYARVQCFKVFRTDSVSKKRQAGFKNKTKQRDDQAGKNSDEDPQSGQAQFCIASGE